MSMEGDSFLKRFLGTLLIMFAIGKAMITELLN